MVTHSRSRVGSISASHTSSGGASMSMVAFTAVMSGTPRYPSAGGELLLGLPVAQRALDCGVERVQPDRHQLVGPIVAREQVADEPLHERADELVILAGDRGRYPARHRRGGDVDPPQRSPDEHR